MNQQYGDHEINRVNQDPLEKWPNNNGEFHIHLEHLEFSALCPRSGYPDSATIVVDYIPGDWVVELKAFKLMINGFRNERISHEEATNQIADRLFKEVHPVSLRVVGDFMRRGGVKTVVTVYRGADHGFDSYSANIL